VREFNPCCKTFFGKIDLSLEEEEVVLETPPVDGNPRKENTGNRDKALEVYNPAVNESIVDARIT